MTTIEMFHRWGLSANPFSIVAPPPSIVEKVFVGRTDELDKLIQTITLPVIPINVNVTGAYGVGKTTFLRRAIQLLSERPDVLAVYLNIEGDTPLHFGTSVLRALDKRLGRQFQKTDYPQSELEKRLEEFASQRVVFFVDQLEYRDPSTVVDLLVGSRSILDLNCSFVITGHPIGITESFYTSASGIFVDRINLRTMTVSELMEIVVNYLNLERSEPRLEYSPFEEEAVREVCEVNRGLPRYVNQDCYKVLDEAAQEQLLTITLDDLNRLYTQLGIRNLQTMPYEIRFWVQEVAARGSMSEKAPDDFMSAVGTLTYTDTEKKLGRLSSAGFLMKQESRYGDIYYSPRSLQLGSQAIKMGVQTPEVSMCEILLDYDHRNHIMCAESKDQNGRVINRTSGEACDIDVDGYFALIQSIPLSANWLYGVRHIGLNLFRETVVQQPTIHAEFSRTLGRTETSGYMSLTFCTTREGLRIPFEIAICQDHLCLAFPVHRYIKDRQCRPPLGQIVKSGEKPIRILLIASDTGGLSAVDNEILAVKKTIEQKVQGWQIQFLSTEDATAERVCSELESGKYHLLHFAGHGFFDQEHPDRSYLVLWKDAAKRDKEHLTASDLKDMVMKTELRFAYLSCCEGTTTGNAYNNFLGVADALVLGGVPEVIGYRWPVADESAKTLATKFYEFYFTNDFSASLALWKARRAIARGPEKRDDSAWASPILIQQY